jgi:uncharacterized protein YdhG (YjbR/CyaY superfamily)
MNRSGSHAQYIASFSGPENLAIRQKLRQLRQLIREVVPQAKESISYGVAGFSLGGRALVYIAGFKSHVSFFPTSSGIRKFRKELAPYPTSRGTVRFRLDAPLPLGLLRRIVRFRVREVRAELG